MPQDAPAPSGAEIAVIGMACRLPGAETPGEYWENLLGGVESVRLLTDEEMLDAGVDARLIGDPAYVRARGVLEVAEYFDAAFFGISRREAEIMDPQHRVILECAWSALEDAGLPPAAAAAPVGVYVGATPSGYLHQVQSNREMMNLLGGYQALIANAPDFLATRVSYKLNLSGPSVAVQTSCSTSLVAIHMACRGLLGGECDVALAGGVSVRMPQRAGYLYQEGGIQSPDGHCRAFDARAQGTVGGSGVGVVVLKRLADALRDGDDIRTVILGTAVNNDGARKVGFTAPSVEGQARAVAEALEMADVQPSSIAMVEAHGTATPLGDPIEVAALTQALGAGLPPASVALGSVKSNIGHCDAAAGVAGFLKAALALERGTIPASLHFERPNPELALEKGPFFVPTAAVPFPGSGPRRAGVSSFGIGGTNAHAILQEPPAPAPRTAQPHAEQLLVLSARSETALENARARLAAHLEHSTAPAADVAYTLQRGRTPFEHRLAFVAPAADPAEAVLGPALVEVLASGATLRGRAKADATVAFLLPGQGAQRAGMGASLYRKEPVFRAAIDDCAQRLLPHLGSDPRTVLLTPGADEALRQTAMAQPALLAVEYALARLWESWGVRPSALLGHSVGEYTAAVLAGIFSLDDALRLVAARGRAMQALPGGVMLALPIAEAEILEHLTPELSLAAVNAPHACVVAGPEAAVAALERALGAVGLEGRRLVTSHAFHSAAIDPVLEELEEAARAARPAAPTLPMLLGATGEWARPGEAEDPGYWARQARLPVRFADAAARLLETEHLLLEVGPGASLGALVRQQGEAARGRTVAASLPEAGDKERAALLRAAGQLWCAGVEIDWDALHPAGSARRVPLPTYPFERLPFIVKADRMVVEAPAAPEVRRNTDAAQWFFVPSWKRSAPLLEADETARPGTGWLLFVDDGGLGEALADRLRAAGERVATVHAGGGFEQDGPETFTIAPDQRRDYEALLARLISSGMRPARIVHLWCANDAAPDDATPAQRFEAAQRRGFDALLLLLQALGTVGHDTLHLDVVTNGAFEVTGGEPLHPEWAAALGPLRVVPQEYPNVRCRGIDVVFTGRASRDRLARQLAAELRHGSADRSVAYRGSHRWIQQYEPLPLSPPRTTDAGFRQDGVYLITGGMGRLGLIVAEHIASRVGARLVLTGRGELPPEAEWESWLEVHHAGDRVGQRIRKLMRLREMGAEVMCVAADVSREEHMRAVVEQAEARWGRIDGVVHAAAITDRGAYREIRATDPAETPPLFRAKVHALHVLERVLEDRELDFVMLFSSLSAIVGGLGFAAYSAANLYMDTFAQQHNRGGRTPWTSVNWDGWVESAGPRQGPGAALAALSLRPEEGADAFQRIVASGVSTQLAVSTTDVQARIDEWTIPEDREHAAAEADLLLPQGGPADGPSASPMTDIEDAVISVWKALLGVDEIGRDDDFLELGGNSLLGIRVLGQLRKRFQVDLPADTIFRASTVSQLADRIMSLLLAEIEMSADAVP